MKNYGELDIIIRHTTTDIDEEEEDVNPVVVKKNWFQRFFIWLKKTLWPFT